MSRQIKLYRMLALKFLGGKCVRCGSTKSLEIHHIDGNPKNNSLDNIELRCRSCHPRGPRPNPKLLTSKYAKHKTTTIKVSDETHEALCELGKKGETFDEIIQRLIKRHWELVTYE